jgi:hypothetical protein
MQKSNATPLVVGLVLLGAVMLIVGVFLPTRDCDENCPDDYEQPLLETDDFQVRYGGEERIDLFNGIGQNVLAIALLLTAGVAVFAAFLPRGLLPAALSLLLMVAYACYVVWDMNIDRGVASFADYSLGYGWFALFGGALLTVFGGLVQALARGRRARQPGYNYQQQYAPREW